MWTHSDSSELHLGSSGHFAHSKLRQFFLRDDQERKEITLNFVRSSTRAFSSFYLSSWALTLCIFVYQISN
jgi:hypothetical protein